MMHGTKEKIIHAAILAHQTWVARFETKMRGINTERFNVETARDSSACDFGKWLASDQSIDILGQEIHHRVVQLHSDFHRIAGEVAENLNRQAPMPDSERWSQDLKQVSRELVGLLMNAKAK